MAAVELHSFEVAPGNYNRQSPKWQLSKIAFAGRELTAMNPQGINIGKFLAIFYSWREKLISLMEIK